MYDPEKALKLERSTKESVELIEQYKEFFPDWEDADRYFDIIIDLVFLRSELISESRECFDETEKKKLQIEAKEILDFITRSLREVNSLPLQE